MKWLKKLVIIQVPEGDLCRLVNGNIIEYSCEHQEVRPVSKTRFCKIFSEVLAGSKTENGQKVQKCDKCKIPAFDLYFGEK